MTAAVPSRLSALAWPASRIGDALTALARHTCLTSRGAETINPANLGDSACASEWIESAAKRLGCEAEAIESNYRDLEADLAFAFPALLRISDMLFLAIVSSRRQKLRVLALVAPPLVFAD